MFPGSRLLRIIPDQPGRGGIKTGVSTHVTNADIRDSLNVYVYNGRWEKMASNSCGTLEPQQSLKLGLPSIGTFTDYYENGDALEILALHNFAKYSLTDAGGVATNYLLGHIYDDTSGYNTIYKFTSSGANLLRSDSSCVPATFINIKNRCFFCWGGTENYVWDGSTLAKVGIYAPSTILTYTAGFTASKYVGLCATTYNCSKITQVGGAVPWQTINAPVGSGGLGFPLAGKTVTIEGTDYIVSSVDYHNGTSSNYATGVGSVASGSTTFTATNAWTAGDFNGLTIYKHTGNVKIGVIGSYSVSGTTTTVSLRGPAAATMSGDTYWLGGDDTAGTGAQITLTTVYTGLTAWSSGIDVRVGSQTWVGSGPQYAYCFYNPTTGHISNASPITSVTEQNQGNVNVHLTGFETTSGIITAATVSVAGSGYSVGDRGTISGGYDNATYEVATLVPATTTVATVNIIEGGAGYTATTGTATTAVPAGGTGLKLNLTVENDPNYTEIVIFRTLLSGGAILYPLADPTTGDFITLKNKFGSYPNGIDDGFDDTYSDSYLLASGPLQLPQILNDPPPVFVHQAYWSGRVWGNPLSDPSGIRYSGDEVQILFGVAEECYPTQNLLRVPAEDGRVTGMVLLGNYLIITTDRYAYYVAGTNESNYQLVRFSSTMFGVGDYQMMEFAGETFSDSPNMIYMGPDWRFYAYNPSSGNSQLSTPLQDKLDLFGDANWYYSTTVDTVRMTQIVGPKCRWLAFTSGITTDPSVLIYDYENKIWYATDQFRGGTFATAYITGSSPVNFVAIPITVSTTNDTITVGVWADQTYNTLCESAWLRTAPLDFERKSLKRLNFVRIYTGGPTANSLIAYPWTCTIIVDEGRETITAELFKPLSDSVRSLYSDSSITAASLSAGGTGYALNDTGTISGAGWGDATYKVTGIGTTPFPVTSFTITNAGTGYSTVTGTLTTPTTGGGNGLEITITGVTGGTPVDDANAMELFYFPTVYVNDATRQPRVEGHRFDVTINFPENESGLVPILYAIDLCVTDLEPTDRTNA